METEWILLIAAGLLEPCWVIALCRTERLRNVPWIIVTVLLAGASMYLLSLALVSLPVGTAYAVWTGIGAVGTLIAGILLYNETVTIKRMLFLILIIAGIIGMRVI